MNNNPENLRFNSSSSIQHAISVLHTELTETARVQAKYNVQHKTPLTESIYRIQFLETIVAPAVQSVIDIIREELVIASTLINTKQNEVYAEKEIKDARNEIHDKQLVIISTKKEIKLYKSKTGNNHLVKTILIVLAYIIAFTDALIAYSSFRTGGFASLQAGAMSAAIFFLLIVSTIVAVPWIKAASKSWHAYLRATLICICVFVAFAGVSYLRAEGLNSIINLSDSIAGIPLSNHYSPWSLLLVSFGLFAGIFLIHLAYYKLSTENAAHTPDNLNEIPQLKREIKEQLAVIKKTQKALEIEKQEARIQYDRFHKLIKRAIHIGDLAQGVYKRTYASYSSTIPDFFHVEQHISYDTEIKFFTPEN